MEGDCSFHCWIRDHDHSKFSPSNAQSLRTTACIATTVDDVGCACVDCGLTKNGCQADEDLSKADRDDKHSTFFFPIESHIQLLAHIMIFTQRLSRGFFHNSSNNAQVSERDHL